MVMYPHIATATMPGTSIKNASGNWESSGESSIVSECRLEPNSSNKFLALTDGKKIDYAAIIYMPLGEIIPAGAKMKVMHGQNVLIETIVKHFHQGQLNQKVWL